MKLPLSLKKSSGFTLIELLIVIAIIGILISIGLAAFGRAQAQARDASRKANIESIRGALEQFYADENEYPGGLPALTPKYMRTVPTPPDSATSFNYEQTAGGQNYCVGDNLETKTGPTTPCQGESLDYVRTARD